MNYMKPFWENRLAECERGREYAEKQLGRLALLEMEQLSIPLEQFMPWMEQENGRDTTKLPS